MKNLLISVETHLVRVTVTENGKEPKLWFLPVFEKKIDTVQSLVAFLSCSMKFQEVIAITLVCSTEIRNLFVSQLRVYYAQKSYEITEDDLGKIFHLEKKQFSFAFDDEEYKPSLLTLILTPLAALVSILPSFPETKNSSIKQNVGITIFFYFAFFLWLLYDKFGMPARRASYLLKKDKKCHHWYQKAAIETLGAFTYTPSTGYGYMISALAIPLPLAFYSLFPQHLELYVTMSLLITACCIASIAVPLIVKPPKLQ